jgi:Novel STAND NTPase 1
VTGRAGRVYVQRAAAVEGSMVVQVGGDLYVSEEGLSALWAAAETVPGECPYPGLDAFGPSQAKWFFGRERLTGDLLDLLDASLRAGRGGPVVVVGSSGAGKSSLLGAGLLKALRDGRLAAAGSDAWPILTITPGPTPLATLTATIGTCAAALAGARAGSPPGPPDSPAAWESAFAALRTSGADQAPQRVTVVVDQFEELFTADCADAERQAFLEGLAALAAPGPDGPTGLVVLGMRADFYGRATEYPVLRTALQFSQLVLGAMIPAEVSQAITRPARAAGLRLEGGLTERLMRDLGVGADGTAYEAGRLPLLAYALRATWQRRSSDRLTIAGYEATGGIGGAIAKAAEDVYAGLNADGQRMAQQLFPRLGPGGQRRADRGRDPRYPAPARPGAPVLAHR